MTTKQKEQNPQVQPIDRLLDLLRTGQWIYGKAADIPEISTMLTTCADACFDINQMRPSLKAERQEAFRKLLGKVGENLVIHSPFRCDFGFNIRIGNNFVGNFNLTILDEAEVTIGDNVMIGPNCSLITITHALDPDQRNEGIMAARPITIGDNAWIATNVVILPGVEIGEGAVIGAGSVVTRSIPAGMLAAGNPCRPLRPVSDSDRVNPVSL